MVTSEYGGDPQQMQQLGQMFNKHSANLAQLIRDLNGRMTHSQTIWKSPEANRFREAWQQAKTSFDKMAEALDKGGKDIKTTAARLEAWGK